MEQTLFALTALFLGAFCMKEYESLCHGQPCPCYNLCEKTSEFEKRFYPHNVWIDTKIESKMALDAAYRRLKSYCDNNGDAGRKISKTWPALIRKVGGEYYMQWFVPPGVSVADDPDLSVTVKTETNVTVYVRKFDGLPSLISGESNADILCQDLDTARKGYNNSQYIGAGYDSSLVTLVPHNEIWVYAAEASDTACVPPEEDSC